MIRTALLCCAGLAAVSTGAVLAPTGAADARQAQCLDRAQAEQLLETLQTRTDQLREALARLERAETARADADRRAEAARAALDLAAERNRELAEIGAAIIDDYEDMSLGRRAANREPLTGLYRVRLENKLQAFEDELAQARLYPERAMQEALSEDQP